MQEQPSPSFAMPPLPSAGGDELNGHADWQALPARGARLAAIGGASGFAILFGPASGLLARALHAPQPWAFAVIGGLLMAACGAYWAMRRHRRITWKLDDQGFAVRRGHWWQSETHVPLSRVQHLDLKRGPLERKLGLSTLVVHTAGTKLAVVNLSGLDCDDAEHLRDQLARQLDDDAL